MKPKTSKVVEQLRNSFPEISTNIQFKNLPWESLQWASFLMDVFQDYPADQSDKLINKLFINSEFGSHTLSSFAKILDEVD